MIRAAYVHVPFCEHICHYCDFNKVFLKNQPVDDYIQALLTEMERKMESTPTVELKTVYIGGGTPTALSAEQLDTLLTEMKRILPLEGIEEFTIEVNPDSIEKTKLDVLKKNGINRLSMGVQTFDSGLLKTIGRTHTKSDVKQAVERCQKAGFSNISIDLMFGLPTQTPSQFIETIEETFKLGVQHISAYSLKIEAKTVFHNLEKKGKLRLPPEDDEVQMYEELLKQTEAAGFNQYEISNFAKEGFESKHNLVYWNNEEYYGFGAGAHGYVEGIRYQNHGPLPKYLNAINHGEEPILSSHVVDLVERIEEEMFMGLRKRVGVEKGQFKLKFGRTLEECFGGQINQLEERGLLRSTKERVMLTERGLLLGNEVFEQFIGVLES